MEKETKRMEVISPGGYFLGAFLGGSIIIGYFAAAILFIVYLLAIIARIYIWIDKFSIHGLGLGVIYGLLAGLGVIIATIIGLVLVMFVIRKVNEFREKRAKA